MATITVPDFVPHPLQDVAQAGSVLREPELLERLHTILPPVQTRASLLHGAVEQERITSLVTLPMLSLMFQALYEAVVLLDTWAEASRDERLTTTRRRAKRYPEETPA